MVGKKEAHKDKRKSNKGIKRLQPEGTLLNFFDTTNNNKKIRTNDIEEEVGQPKNTKLNQSNGKKPNIGSKLVNNPFKDPFNCQPIIEDIRTQEIKEKIFWNQTEIINMKGTRLIAACPNLKKIGATLVKKQHGKFDNINEQWINDQFGLCLRGVLCYKKGKLFSSKYKPRRTAELLDFKITDRIVSWLCGFSEEKKNKHYNDNTESSDSIQMTNAKPKKTIRGPVPASKGFGGNFFGCNNQKDEIVKSPCFSKPANRILSDSQKPKQRKRLKKVEENLDNGNRIGRDSGQFQKQQFFKKPDNEQQDQNKTAFDMIKENANRTKYDQISVTESGDSDGKISGLESQLAWEHKQFKYNGLIFCGAAGMGKRATVSTICQSAKIEVENIDCCLYENFKDIKDRYHLGVHHQDVKINQNDNNNKFNNKNFLMNFCNGNISNNQGNLSPNHQNNENPNIHNSADKKDQNRSQSQVTSKIYQNEKLKGQSLKKIFVLNNFEYLFKDEMCTSWANTLKSVLDFFNTSSYPFIITTNPKNAQILGDYLEDFDIIVNTEPENNKISCLQYLVLYCEKFAKQIGLCDCNKLLSSESSDDNGDPSDAFIKNFQDRMKTIKNLEEVLDNVKVDQELIIKYVEYFEGNLNALFSRLEIYQQAFYYDEKAKKRLLDDLILWRIDRQDLDEELVVNVLNSNSYQQKNTKSNKMIIEESGNLNIFPKGFEIKLDEIKVSNIPEYITIHQKPSKEYTSITATTTATIPDCLIPNINHNNNQSSSTKKNNLSAIYKKKEDSCVNIPEVEYTNKENVGITGGQLTSNTNSSIDEMLSMANCYDDLSLKKQLMMLNQLVNTEPLTDIHEHIKDQVLDRTLDIIDRKNGLISEEFLKRRSWIYHENFLEELTNRIKVEKPHDKIDIDLLEYYSNCYNIKNEEKIRGKTRRTRGNQDSPNKSSIQEKYFSDKETLEMFKQIKQLRTNMLSGIDYNEYQTLINDDHCNKKELDSNIDENCNKIQLVQT